MQEIACTAPSKVLVYDRRYLRTAPVDRTCVDMDLMGLPPVRLRHFIDVRADPRIAFTLL